MIYGINKKKRIYVSATEFAIDRNHQEIVELLSSGPSQASKRILERKKKLVREKIALRKQNLLEKKKHRSEINDLKKRLHEFEYLDAVHSSLKNILDSS